MSGNISATITDGKMPRIPVIKSRIPQFYENSIENRLSSVASLTHLNMAEQEALGHLGSLSPELLDTFIENAIGTFALPLGIATNFVINGRDVLVPMAVEETSVVAAASHGAKFARAGGGFIASSSEPLMVGQIQLFLEKSVGLEDKFEATLNEHKERLLNIANSYHVSLNERGGGVKNLTWYYIPEISSLIVNVVIHTCDAMGANIVNTTCEKLSVELSQLFACECGLRILTNLSDKRLTRSEVTIPKGELGTEGFPGEKVVERIVKAYEFAYFDPYRAATNNKGVMNGIDPILIATGNDWRAVEAGAHAYAMLSGRYRPFVKWSQTPNGDLHGFLEMPMAVGVVGGVTRLHPTAQAVLKVMGYPDAKRLAEICVSVGLAQNLSALRALASEGIQRGHMDLHHKNLELMRIKKP